jgi:hypothetical protein
MEYFITVDGQTEDDQKSLNKITSVRIGKIISVLQLKRPSPILPFLGNFPLVPEIQYEFFLNQTKKAHRFEELGEQIKQIVYKAEKIVFYHNSFKKHLIDIEELGVKGFKLLSIKEQEDAFYRWMFKNKIDVGLLKIG